MEKRWASATAWVSMLMLVLTASPLIHIANGQNFNRVGALTFNSGENGLGSSVIDSAAGFAYFGTDTSPGVIVKVRLSNFTRVGSLVLNTGEDHLQSAVIDPAGGDKPWRCGAPLPSVAPPLAPTRRIRYPRQ